MSFRVECYGERLPSGGTNILGSWEYGTRNAALSAFAHHIKRASSDSWVIDQINAGMGRFRIAEYHGDRGTL